MPVNQLIFVDTNIWLDFYRVRNEAGISLLNHLEQIADRVIVTYQLEMEYKRNRHAAILEGLRALAGPEPVPRPGIFSDSKTFRALQSSHKASTKRVSQLKKRLTRALEAPTKHDPVYQACQRIFHGTSDLILHRDNPIRRTVKRRALKRFLLGCPPRKKNDTSMGDAVNWEWMIECANRRGAELVVVSRDSDYGVDFEGKVYVNDHLRHEFSDRVSRKRKLLLYTHLAKALKHFKLPVSKEETEGEEEVAKARRTPPQTLTRMSAESLKSWLSIYMPEADFMGELVKSLSKQDPGFTLPTE